MTNYRLKPVTETVNGTVPDPVISAKRKKRIALLKRVERQRVIAYSRHK